MTENRTVSLFSKISSSCQKKAKSIKRIYMSAALKRSFTRRAGSWHKWSKYLYPDSISTKAKMISEKRKRQECLVLKMWMFSQVEAFPGDWKSFTEA